jgi:hypothetical protein
MCGCGCLSGLGCSGDGGDEKTMPLQTNDEETCGLS